MWKRISWFLDQVGRAQLIAQILMALATGTLITATINTIMPLSGLWFATTILAASAIGIGFPVWAKEKGWLKDKSVMLANEHPAAQKPNLKTRRGYVNTVVIGNTGHRALIFEIGNDLIDGKTPGFAREIKAHITFFNEQHEKLEQVCPAYWDNYLGHDTVSIPAGESRPLAVIFADYREDLSSRYSHGISLRGCKFIELILLDKHGNTVREEKFEFEKPLDRGIQSAQ